MTKCGWRASACISWKPVVADGGELIIYAPHVHEISVTHGKLISEIGYHCRDYFFETVGQVQALSVGRHCALNPWFAASARFENGVEKCRVHWTLATGIPESVLPEINLGYRGSKKHSPGGICKPRGRRRAAGAKSRRDCFSTRTSADVGGREWEIALKSLPALALVNGWQFVQ